MAAIYEQACRLLICPVGLIFRISVELRCQIFLFLRSAPITFPWSNGQTASCI